MKKEETYINTVAENPYQASMNIQASLIKQNRTQPTGLSRFTFQDHFEFWLNGINPATTHHWVQWPDGMEVSLDRQFYHWEKCCLDVAIRFGRPRTWRAKHKSMQQLLFLTFHFCLVSIDNCLWISSCLSSKLHASYEGTQKSDFDQKSHTKFWVQPVRNWFYSSNLQQPHANQAGNTHFL